MAKSPFDIEKLCTRSVAELDFFGYVRALVCIGYSRYKAVKNYLENHILDDEKEINTLINKFNRMSSEFRDFNKSRAK